MAGAPSLVPEAGFAGLLVEWLDAGRCRVVVGDGEKLAAVTLTGDDAIRMFQRALIRPTREPRE